MPRGAGGRQRQAAVPPHRSRAVNHGKPGPLVHAFFVWLESTALNQWIVGSPSLWAFPGILAVHAIGMGFAAGLSAAIDLRVLGIAP